MTLYWSYSQHDYSLSDVFGMNRSLGPREVELQKIEDSQIPETTMKLLRNMFLYVKYLQQFYTTLRKEKQFGVNIFILYCSADLM